MVDKGLLAKMDEKIQTIKKAALELKEMSFSFSLVVEPMSPSNSSSLPNLAWAS